MKRWLVPAAIPAVLLCLAAAAEAADEADVYASPTLLEARAAAAESGKAVLIHFYTPG
jgi:hypothetical protein